MEEHSNTDRTPYLFNGKELDEETGLYYYGARYYDAKTSVWQSVDPLALYDPVMQTEHYIDGQHNGGYFNPRNTSVYGYCYQNPVKYVDPNGKQSVPPSVAGVGTQIELAFGSWFGSNKSSYRLSSVNLKPKVGMQIYGNNKGGDVISGNGATKSDGSMDASDIVNPSGKGLAEGFLKGFRVGLKTINKLQRAWNEMFGDNDTPVSNNSDTSDNMINMKLATDDSKIMINSVRTNQKGDTVNYKIGFDKKTMKDTLMEPKPENFQLIRERNTKILRQKISNKEHK